jgi:hypothetical protein
MRGGSIIDYVGLSMGMFVSGIPRGASILFVRGIPEKITKLLWVEFVFCL